jgi:hypothetical protein
VGFHRTGFATTLDIKETTADIFAQASGNFLSAVEDVTAPGIGRRVVRGWGNIHKFVGDDNA